MKSFWAGTAVPLSPRSALDEYSDVRAGEIIGRAAMNSGFATYPTHYDPSPIENQTEDLAGTTAVATN
jgi:hypothetical protein